MKLSGLTKMVKRQLVCNVFHNDESDDFYIGTASAIYCATGFPRPLNRNQMGAMLGISEDTMIEKVVYNDFDCAYKIDFQGFNLDDTIKDEVEVKKLGIGIYCSGEILIPLVTEDRHMVLYYLWHSDRKYLQNSLKVQQKKINLLKTKMLCRTRLCWMH